MILDSVLLAVADILLKRDNKPLAIFPEMKIFTDSDGVLVTNPTTNFEV
jgi:hypothetical protein